MKILRLIIPISFLLSINNVYSQDKNKRLSKRDKMYQEFHENERIKKLFSPVYEEANKLFRDKKYHQAVDKYIDALEINPKDVQSKAKIRDIEIILANEIEPEIKKDVVENISHIKPQQLENEENVSSEKTIEGNKIEIIRNNFVEIEDNEKELKVKTETKQVSKDSIPTNISTPVTQEIKNEKETEKSNEKIEKSSNKYRESLAKNFPEGWTEKFYTENKREITKRIHVMDNLGDEYLKVKHPWGGIYYFKNGSPINLNAWLTETENK